jgi:hypothetical protein
VYIGTHSYRIPPRPLKEHFYIFFITATKDPLSFIQIINLGKLLTRTYYVSSKEEVAQCLACSRLSINDS